MDQPNQTKLNQPSILAMAEGGRDYNWCNPGSSSGGGTAAPEGEGSCMKEQDRLLPIANVGRIMKQILPPNAKISKEAKETMQECASEFISFVTGEASDRCHKEKRKTVNGDDIHWALGSLGFDNYADAMKRYLHKYREYEMERAAAAVSRSGGVGSDEHDLGMFGGGGGTYQPSTSTPTLRFNVMDRNNASPSNPRGFN